MGHSKYAVTQADRVERAVRAKIEHWSALRKLEKLFAPEGEFSDAANNAVIEYIDSLAAATTPGVAFTLERKHLDKVKRLCKL